MKSYRYQRNRWVRSRGGKAAVWLALAQLTFWQCVPVWALPTGEQVQHGDVSFSRSGNRLTVQQASGRAIVNYSTFDIGVAEGVDFIQPGASAAILNRVVGGSGSHIAGELTANGQVYLVNPNGILFSSSARVNVGGLVASAMPMSDSDFLSGRLFFSGKGGAVINEGDLRGSFVYLVGGQVENRGVIRASDVVMAAGRQSVLIDDAAGGQIRLVIDGTDQLLDGLDLVDEPGAAGSAGAGVESAAKDLAASASESESATETVPIASAWDAGTIMNEGAVDASGISGGRIVLSGIDVGQGGSILADGTELDGGSIDILGQGVVAMMDGSLTSANAGDTGDGGSILIIADSYLRVGNDVDIQARGGAESGAGGFVETSGMAGFEIGAAPDVSAPAGEAGTWLIDPFDIEIVAGAGNVNINAAHPFISFDNSAQLGVNLILAGLGTGNVLVETGAGGAQLGNITVSTPIDYSALSNRLWLDAHNDIIINAAIDAGPNVLRLLAGNNISQTAPITAGGLAFTALGGNVVLDHAANAIDNVAGSAAGSFTIVNGQALAVSTVDGFTGLSGAANSSVETLAGDLTLAEFIFLAGGNSVHLGAADAIDQTGGFINAGSMSFIAAGGGVTLEQAMNNVATIAGSASGEIRIRDLNTLTIGTVGAQSGLTSGGNDIYVDVTANNLTIAENINANVGEVYLTAGGEIDQTGGSITASGLSFDAGGAVTLDEPGNDITTIAGTAGGEIHIVSADGLTVGIVGSQTGLDSTGNNIFLDVLANDLVLAESVDAGAGNLEMTAGGLINQTGGSITADGVSFDAGDGVTLDEPGNNMTTIAGTAAGEIRIMDADGLTVGSVGTQTGLTSGGNNIFLDVTANDLILAQSINAGAGDLEMTAGGEIDQTGGSLTAAGVSFDAGGAVSLDQAGNDMTTIAGTAAGEMHIVSADGLTVGSVGAQTGLDSDGNDIFLDVLANDLVLAENVDAGVGDLEMTVGGQIDQTGGSLTAAGVSFDAGGAVTLDEAGNVITTVAGSAGGEIHVVSADGLTVGSAGTHTGLDSDGNNILLDVTANDLVLTENVNAGAGDLHLTAGGAIDQTGGSITAAGVSFDAAGGSAFLDEAGNTFTTVAGTAGGFILIETAGGLTVGSVGTLTGLLADSGLRIFAADTLTIDEATSTTMGHLLLTTTGTGDIDINAAVGAGGSISVVAADGVTQGAAGMVMAGGTLDVEAQGGSITMADGATGSAIGNVRYLAANDVTLGGVSGADVRIEATGGSILDGGDVDVDVTAANAQLVAGDSVGSSAIDTALGTLAVSAGTGSILVEEADGLTIGTVAAIPVDRVQADGTLDVLAGSALAGANADQDVVIHSGITGAGDLTVDASVVSANGAIDLDSQQGNLSVDAPLTASNGGIFLGATGDVDVDAALTAGGNVELAADTDTSGVGGVTVNQLVNTGGGDFTATGFSFVSSDTGMNNGEIQTEGGDVTITVADSATVGADILTGTAIIDGGSITITAAEGVTISNAKLDTQTGAGGVSSIGGGVTLQGGLTELLLGAGDITLDGGGLDLILDAFTVNFDMADGLLTALRDVRLINNTVITSDAGINITIAADSDGVANTDGMGTAFGGVFIEAGSSVTSGGSLIITGTELLIDPTRSINVAGQVSAQDDVTITGNAAANTGIRIADVTSVAGGVQVESTDGIEAVGPITAATALDLEAAGDIDLAGVLTAAAINAHAGTDGTGDLSGAGTLNADAILLRAGDGPAGAGTMASVDASGLTLQGTAGAGTSPGTYTHRADGDITAAQIAAGAQFGDGTAGIVYLLQSDDGSVTIGDSTSVAGTELTVSGATGVDINADLNVETIVVTGAPLTIGGDVIAATSLILNSDATLNGAVDQRLDAGAGVLDVQALTKTAAGDLTLAGDAGVQLPDTVEVLMGGLLVEDTLTASGDILASAGITLEEAVTLDGANQRIDAGTGTLHAQASLEKTTAGDLALAGDTLVRLDGNVDVADGTLTVEDDLAMGGTLALVSGDIVLQGLTTFDGTGAQTMAATGTLTAQQDVSKTTTGTLTLMGMTLADLQGSVETADGAIFINSPLTAAGDITAVGGAANLTGPSTVAGNITGQGVFSSFSITMNGAGNQFIDATTGLLDADATITKTTAGNLTLSGDAGIEVGGTADAQLGELILTDAVLAGGNLLGSAGVTLQAPATMIGAGDQRIDAGTGTLDAQGTITKTTAGNLTLAADTLIDLAATVNAQSGILILEDAAQVAADLLGGGGVTLQAAVTMNGVGDQRIAAGTGTLDAQDTITKTTAGDLALAGGTLIDLAATVEAQLGVLIIEDDAEAAGDLLGNDGVTLMGAVLMDGAGNQVIDAVAGTLTSMDTITKSTPGNLNLRGSTLIDLGDTVEVQLGILTIEDEAEAAGDLLGNAGVTLMAAVTLDGVGDQRIDAGTGTLDAQDTITKATAGNLNLAADTLIDLAGTVHAQGGILTIEDEAEAAGDLLGSDGVTLMGAVLMDGAGDQVIDAVAGTLTSMDTITKSMPGNLNLRGSTLIDLGDTVEVQDGQLIVEDVAEAEGDLIGSDGVTLMAAVTMDGAGDQRIEGGTGTLDAQSTITKTAPGNLNLSAGTLIDLAGTVHAQGGILTIEDVVEAEGNLLGDGGVTLMAAATMDGAGDQRIDGGTGTLDAQDTITKTTAGNLILAGDTLVDLAATVHAQDGGLIIEDDAEAAGDLLGSDGVTLMGAVLMDGAGNQVIDAVAGTLTSMDTITKSTPGNLNLRGSTLIDLGDTVEAQDGQLIVEDVAEAEGDLLGNAGVTLMAAVTMDGAGDQRIDGGTGTLDAQSTITKTTPGNLNLAADTLIDLAGTVDTQGGILTVEDVVEAEGNLLGDGGVTLMAAATMDGAGDQRIDGGTGILDAQDTIIKSTPGNLILAGETLVDLAATVHAQDGGLIIEDDAEAAGDLLGSDGVTLMGAVLMDGAGNQVIDAVAGTLTSMDTITKSTPGNLNLRGSTLIDLGDTVEVQDGQLIVEDVAEAEGDLIGSDGVTLMAAVTMDGAGDQRIDGGTGTLDAQSTITKTTPGNLNLRADTLIDLAGTVHAQGGILTIEDVVEAEGNLLGSDGVTLQAAVTMDGAGDQRIDGGTGTLDAQDTIIKSTPGNLILAGETLVDLAATVHAQDGGLIIEDDAEAAGDLLGSDGVTLMGAVLMDGAGNQIIDAGVGTLASMDTITKSTTGNLNLRADTLIDLGGTVEAQDGQLIVEDVAEAEGDLLGSDGVTLMAAVTMDGAGDQRIDGGTGTLDAQSTITKTVAGNLALGGDTLVSLADDVAVLAGDLTIEDAFTAAADLFASGNTTLEAPGTMTAAGTQTITADTGQLDVQAGLTKALGDLHLVGGQGIDLDGIILVSAGNLDLQSASGSAVQQGGSILSSTVSFNVDGDLTLDELSNQIDTVAGTAGGDILIVDADSLEVGSAGAETGLTSTGGGVEVATVDGLLLVNEAVTAAGGVKLDSRGAGQDVVVNAPVMGEDCVVVQAANDVVLNEDVTSTGDLALWADADEDGVGNIVQNSGTAEAVLGNLFVSGQEIIQGGASTFRATNATAILNAGGDVNLGGTLSGIEAKNIVIGGNNIIIDTTVTAAEAIVLHARSGSIFHSAPGLGQIIGQTLGLVAANDVGISAANPLTVDSDFLGAFAQGDKFVLELSTTSAGLLLPVGFYPDSGPTCAVNIPRPFQDEMEIINFLDDLIEAEEFLNIVVNGDLIGGVLLAGQNATVQVLGSVDLDEIRVGGLADISVNANFSVDLLTASSLLLGVGGSGNIGSLQVTGPATMNFGGSLNGGSMNVGGPLNLFVGGNWNQGSVALGGATDNITVQGNANVGSLSDAGSLNLNVGGSYAGSSLAVGNALNGNIGGNMNVGALSANTANLNVGGSYSGGSMSIAGPLTATIGNDIVLGSLNAGSLTLTAGGSGLIDSFVVSGNALATFGRDLIGNTISIGGATDFTIGGRFQYNSATFSGPANIRTGGDFEATTLNAGSTFTGNIGGSFLSSTATIAGNADLDVGRDVRVNNLTVNGVTTARTGGDWNVDTGRHGNNTTLNIGGAMTTRDTQVSGNLDATIARNLTFDRLQARNTRITAGSIDLGQLTTGTAAITSRGAINNRSGNLVASSLSMSAGGNIGANSPIPMNVGVINLVSGGGNVSFIQNKPGDTPIGLLSAGGSLNVSVPNGGFSDGNGDALNIRSGGNATFNVQYLGTSRDALEVDIGGNLFLDGAGRSGDTLAEASRIFANLVGFIGGDGRRIQYIGLPSIPGLVIFNGQLLLGNQLLLTEVARSEAFVVETPEIKSPQGVFGEPYFIHVYMQISEAWNLFLDYILFGQAEVNADPELPPEAKRNIQIGGAERPFAR